MIAFATLATLAALGAGPALSLDAALERARAHPRVDQARAALLQAQARVGEARAGYLPSANAALGYSRATAITSPQAGTGLPYLGATSSGAESFPLYSASLSVSQPIWNFGRTSNAVNAAQTGARATELDLATARADVELGVRLAYFGALAAVELEHAAAESVAQMERHLAVAQALVEVGKRPRFDATKAEVDLGNARITLLQAQNGIATSRSALANAMGEQSLGELALARPAHPDEKNLSPEEAVARALAGRPELASLEARVQSQEAAVAAQRSSYLPSLDAGGQMYWRGSDFPLARNWQVGATLSVPLLAGGGDFARVKEQEAALEQARAGRAALVLQVRQDAEQAALAVAEARARHEAALPLVAQARENNDLAEGRYQAGVGNIIELNDAQGALVAAQSQAIRAEYDLASSRARLARAMGGR